LGEIDPRDLLHPLGDHLQRPPWWLRRLPEELATLMEGAGFAAVGEEPIVAEADKAGGEHMQEEALQEGMGVDGHRLEAIAMAAVPVDEADLAIAHLHDAVVRQGHSVSVAADIVHDLRWACKGRFRIHHPGLRIELIEKPLEACSPQ
jgi:hypothetical protein